MDWTGRTILKEAVSINLSMILNANSLNELKSDS